ncbi:MAG: DUF4293 domain-containing protein [Chitinophagaceae bacterium]
MIQRQQSLWLLLACVASALSFYFPFYSGEKVEEGVGAAFSVLDAGSNFFLVIVTGISVLLGGITIFLFKDRKAQFKLALGGVGISVLLLFLYMREVSQFTKGNFALTALLVIAILVGYIMAARGIWKDEKLVKSLDKLR